MPGFSSLLSVDMVTYMKDVVKSSQGDLTIEERNLFSVAYKNVIGARRASWRILSSVEQKAGDAESIKKKEAQASRQKVEGELSSVCKEVLKVIDDDLLPAAEKKENSDECQVFYHKM